MEKEKHIIQLPALVTEGHRLNPFVSVERKNGRIYSVTATRQDGTQMHCAHIAKSSASIERAAANWSADPSAFVANMIHVIAVRVATRRLKSARIAHQIAAKVHAEARIWKVGAATEDDRLWELATRVKLDDATSEVAAAEAEVRRLQLAKP